MLTYLYLITIAFSIFAFLFYRAVFVKHARALRYKAYGNAVYKSVGDHFDELKSKQAALTVDKGYGNIDDSAWKDEVINFVNLVVTKRLSGAQVNKIKTTPGFSLEFYTFCVNYILDLLCYAKLPENDYLGVIEDIESPSQNNIIPSRTAAFQKTKQYAGRVAVVLAVIAFAGVEELRAAEWFSPFDACNALIEDEGFTPSESGYHQYEGSEEFGCSTPYKDLGSELMPNNIALYAKGNSASAVHTVYLVLNVNVPGNGLRDLKYMSKMCGKVATGLVGQAADKFSSDVAKGKPFSTNVDGYELRLEKESWPTGRGYEYRCYVSVQGSV